MLVQEESYFIAFCFIPENYFDEATKIVNILELLEKSE